MAFPLALQGKWRKRFDFSSPHPVCNLGKALENCLDLNL